MPLKMYNPDASPPMQFPKNCIAIAAGKGGVGKSTVTVNLALALKKRGCSVGVLDADIYGPSIRRMLPEDRLPKQKGALINPAVCSGIKMISMAYFRRDNEAAAVRAPIANGIISQFLKQVDWGGIDYLLIDFPPGTGDVQLTLSQQANLSGAILVTTPQEVAMMDVRKAMHLFEQVKVPILGVVENMSHYFHAKSGEKLYIFGQGGGRRLAGESGYPFLGEIPIDPELCQKGDLGQSIFEGDQTKKSLAAETFLSLAETLKLQLYSIKSRDQPIPLSIKTTQEQCEIQVLWSDEVTTQHRLSDLQKRCPCAKCVDETTGKRLLDVNSIKENVRAIRIMPVGRYAIRIEFDSGCSMGIYDFAMLRKY
jgi:ATP-binding protein involved in chromosome partitioning